MLKRFWSALFLILPLSVCAGEDDEPEGLLINRVVAIVDNDTVTSLEVEQTVAQYRRSMPDATPAQIADAKKKARDMLIDQILLLQEAKRRKITVPPERVNEEIQRLKKAGMDDAEERRDLIRDRLVLSRFLALVRTPRAVTPQEVEEYYHAHGDEFMMRERRHVMLIVINPQELKSEDGRRLTRDEALKFVEDLHKQLVAGEDFAAMAKKHSSGPAADKGGDLGWFAKGVLRQEQEDLVFAMKPGEVSRVIESPDGFQIFKLAGIQPPTQKPLAEAREAILERLESQQRRRQETALLKRLRDGASIILLDLEPKSDK
jgi:parvulin-like peptidyl-prolyl isomerase